MKENGLSLRDCIKLIDSCVKANVLNVDPKRPNNILVYCHAGKNSPEGWYSQNAIDAASELCEDVESQRVLIEALNERLAMAAEKERLSTLEKAATARPCAKRKEETSMMDNFNQKYQIMLEILKLNPNEDVEGLLKLPLESVYGKPNLTEKLNDYSIFSHCSAKMLFEEADAKQMYGCTSLTLLDGYTAEELRTAAKWREKVDPYAIAVQKLIRVQSDMLKRKENPNLRPLEVRVTCTAVYDSTILVPCEMNLSEAYKYAREHLDEAFVSELVYVPNSDVLKEADCKFGQETDEQKKQRFWQRFQHDVSVLAELDEKAQTSKICMEAVRKNGLALEFVRNQTPEICFAAVERCSGALQFVKNQTPEICLAAVLKDGMALRCVKNKTPEIIAAALSQNKNAIQWI